MAATAGANNDFNAANLMGLSHLELYSNDEALRSMMSRLMYLRRNAIV